MSNRHERRRRAADQRRRAKEWGDFHEDTGGAFRLTLHRRSQFDIVQYLAARLAGDLQAAALDIALEVLAKAATEGGLPNCLVCGTPLARLPPIIVTMLPERSDPSAVIASGICPACAEATDAQIMATIEEVLRGGAWPELRALDMAQVSTSAGRA
jgi:hypothetical protein